MDIEETSAKVIRAVLGRCRGRRRVDEYGGDRFYHACGVWADGARGSQATNGCTDTADRGSEPRVCSRPKRFAYLGGTVTENADLMIEIKRWIILAIICPRKRSKLPYDRPSASVGIKVRMLKAV